jgi:uncharacterized protein
MSHNFHTIPVLVFGIFNAGKTEVIRAISEIEVVSTEYAVRKNEPLPEPFNAAMDFGRLTIPVDSASSILLYFFGEPDSKRMPPIETLMSFDTRRRVGMLLVVDSAKTRAMWWEEPSEDTEAIYREDKFRLSQIQEKHYPWIVLANKQDKPDARSHHELRAILGIPSEIPVLPTSAKTDPASVRYAVLELLIRLPQDEIVKMAIEKFPLV